MEKIFRKNLEELQWAKPFMEVFRTPILDVHPMSPAEPLRKTTAAFSFIMKKIAL